MKNNKRFRITLGEFIESFSIFFRRGKAFLAHPFEHKFEERDYNKLSERTREEIKDRYENILKVLFVQK